MGFIDLLTRKGDRSDGETSLKKSLLFALRRPSLILMMVGVISILVLTLLYSWSHAKQVELENTLREQMEQLERQNEIITGLMAKQDKASSNESVPIITSQTLKEEIQSLSELVTKQYIYTNADKRESNANWVFGWTIPFSSSSLLVTYDGVIKAGVDLKDVLVDVNEENHTITITLPESKITDNNIPQETITVVEVKDGLFNEVTFDNYNEFISEQKIVMEQKAINNGFIQEADKEARAIVKSFVSFLPGVSEYNLIVE